MSEKIILILAAAGILAMTACSRLDTSDENFESGEPDSAAFQEVVIQIETESDETYSIPDIVLSEERAVEEITEAEPVLPDYEKPDGYELSGYNYIDVPVIYQNPELPTGCEVTALTTVLNYYDFEIDKVTLCDEYLPITYYADKTFDEAFVGNPKTADGFGCNAPVIAVTANSYFEDIGADWEAVDMTGTDFYDLFYQIDMNIPVIVWASMGLLEADMTYRWTTADGDEAWFAELEHCMVLKGYDLNSGIVYVSDPLKGEMTYSIDRFEYIYNNLEQQAVILLEKELPQ